MELSYIDLPLTNDKLLPLVQQAPAVELKPLSDHLKYVFLGDNNTLPVIIAKGLEPQHKAQLIKVLKAHKTTIGWTIADIKGIGPSLWMHKILLEEEIKPSREGQRRLNPPMTECWGHLSYL